MPIDFGSTAVTGIHVSCVAALRDHFGLEKRPVKVHEPFQMLGLLDEDLKQVLGIDVEGVFRRRTMFGFENKDWKPWDFNGLEVLVPGSSSTTVDAKGDTLIYPEGDLAAEPSGRMPKGFHFFDAIIRQRHFDPDNLNVADNLEEFQPLSDTDLAAIKADVDAARASGRAVIANFGGTALGDIALVPAPFLKDPRGIRDVGEWYMSLKSRRDYIHGIFERQTEIALAEPGAGAPDHRRCGGRGLPLRHGLRHPDLGVLLGADLPRTLAAVLQADLRLDPRAHDVEVLQAFLRLGASGSTTRSSRRGSRSSTRSSARRRVWIPSRSSRTSAIAWSSGAAAWTPRRRFRSGPRTRCASRCSGAARSSRRGRFRLQLDSQHPGRYAGREHRGDVRRRARVQRAGLTSRRERTRGGHGRLEEAS